MKKSLIVFAGILFALTGMISAYSFSPSSIGEMFDQLGGDNLFLGGVLLVSFAFLFWAFNRTAFKDNTAVSAIISIVISSWITYAFYKNGITFNITDMFYGFGFSDMVIDLIVFFVGIGILLLLIFKLKTNTLLVVGVILLISGFFGLEGTILPIVGGILVFIWIMAKYIPYRAKNTVYGMPSNNFKFGFGFKPKLNIRK